MCGIAGILLSPSCADRRCLNAVTQMTDALRHRGPDGEGFWVDRTAGVALGHRRLAIVDLSEAGSQPMTSHGGDLIVACNGEIYNFDSLRATLERRGHRFRGHSDTEAMLTAFEAYGIESALGGFAGMFALALWDREGRTLHLARDRLGKKPLYVALTKGALLFASELRALRRFPGFEPVLDERAVAFALRYGWVPDSHCIWKGVFKVPPGTLLSVSAADLDRMDAAALKARAHSWWSLAAVAEAGQKCPRDLEPSRLAAELDELLRLAVRERMVADVPLGAFLSGGIDSSTVVALMQAQSRHPIRTFTIGFCEGRYDESAHSAAIARHLGTDHTELRLTPAETLALIPEMPHVWDEPFADESQLPTLLLARLARQHVTVALTGDGGDEAFGGYARHAAAARLAPLLALPMRPRRLTAQALGFLGSDAWDRILTALPGRFSPAISGARLHKFAGILDAAGEGEIYDRLIAATLEPPGRGTAIPDPDPFPLLPDAASRFIYRDMAHYLPGDVLVKLDRASMSVGLEGRCPLLDHRLIEFAWSLPTSAKIRGGTTKWLLRKVLRRYLPDALFDRPKQGFDVPIAAWLRGPLRGWAEGLLSGTRLRRHGLLDAERIGARWQEHLSGRRDRSLELWSILMIEAWLAAEEDPPAATQPPATRTLAEAASREG